MSDPFVIHNQDNTIKDNRIENYFDKTLEGDFLYEGERESMQLSVKRNRIVLFFGLVILGLTIIFFRIFWLQTVRGDYYRNIAEGNRIRVEPVRANRGVIFDRDYNLLLQNRPQFSLFFIPADLPKDEVELNQTLEKVTGILEMPASKIKKIVEESSIYSYEPVLVTENVPYEKALTLEIESSNLAGVFLEIIPQRLYIKDVSGLSHILGYTGKLTSEEFKELKDEEYLMSDYIGKTGIEKTYEEILRGRYGKKQIEVDFLGKEEKILSALEAESGKDLILSIDLDLQKKIGDIFRKQAGSKNGAVIIEEVESGQILAIVSWPDYDNNLFTSGILSEDYERLVKDDNKPLFNRAIAGEYPPGSIFKLVMAAGALEDKIVDKDDRILSSGGIQVDKWFFPDWKAGGHGLVSIKEAIADSVNTFFYYIGGGYSAEVEGTQDFEGLGLDKINYWAGLFGLGQEIGVDLVGEEDGFLPTKKWKQEYKGEPWYIGDTYHLSIGQGDILVTPLQIVNYTVAIANGGTLYQPRIVMGTIGREADGQVNFEPNIIRKDFAGDDNLAIVREGMREAVIYGSSRALADLPVEVAGKTGTAQVGGDKEPHSWFTGFAPYDLPEIAITVLVENGGEGSRVAVPIAREILDYYFSER